MDTLALILVEIIKAEYAQWMRYNYLSALGYGLYTDILAKHFKEHAYEELKHGEIISRWVVDLGFVPPTTIPVIEQFCGTTKEAINWLLDAEFEGISKYLIARELACNFPGLQADIDNILTIEHEHVSDLGKLVNPIFKETEDPTIIVVSSLARNTKFNCKKAQKKPFPDPTQTPEAFIADYLKWAADEYGEEYTPKLGREFAKDKIISELEYIDSLYQEVEQGRVDEDEFRSWVELAPIYISILDWLQLSTVENNWNSIHDTIWPDYQSWLVSDMPEEVEPEEVEPEEDRERIIRERSKLWKTRKPSEEVEPVETEPIEEVDIESLYRQTYEEHGKELEPEETRPAEEELKTILVKHPKKKDEVIEVGEGTSIRNLSIADTIPRGRPHRTQKSTGKIMEILPDGSVKVKTHSGKEEVWYAEDEFELDLRELPKFRTATNRSI